MKVFTNKAELQKEVKGLKESKKRVGLVPTMGALHSGHASLIKRCSCENDICIASVFVNPTQFNDKNDLKTYPRTPQEDKKLLEENGCDIVFMPSVEEMYPQEDNRVFDLGPVARVMEGAYREGHFNGVAQIVSKLFYMVSPDVAYFGEKDFQQIAVIRSMVKSLDIPVKIVSCPIIREADGLAMSSRNKRLSAEGRKKAPKIAKVLSESRNFVNVKSVNEVKSFVKKELSKDSLFKIDYYDIVDGNTLQSVDNWDSDYIVGCIAIYVGDVREIDNIIYKNVD